MNITCTVTEAQEFIAKYKAVDSVTISDPVRQGMSFVEAMLRITRIENGSNGVVYANQKIPAIKRLREYVPELGLAEAKNAIENPEKAIDHFLRNGSVAYSY
jgi:ribosomal protein L7/L12